MLVRYVTLIVRDQSWRLTDGLRALAPTFLIASATPSIDLSIIVEGMVLAIRKVGVKAAS